MNRNIRASHFKTTDGRTMVRNLDIIDNNYLIQIDAVGVGDLRDVDVYAMPTIGYHVKIEDMILARNSFGTLDSVYGFNLSACPITTLTDIPDWLSAIPIDAVAAYSEMEAIKTLLGIVFSHCVGAGRLGLCMIVQETGWVRWEGHHTLDAHSNNPGESVRIQYEVKNGLVRFKRTTVIQLLSTNKRMTEIVPFAQVWPHFDGGLNADGLTHLIDRAVG